MGVTGEQRRVVTSLVTAHGMSNAHAVSLFGGEAA